MKIHLLCGLVAGFALLAGSPALAQTLDPSFVQAELYRPAPVKAAVGQPDGKQLVLGTFAQTEVGPDRVLMRYNADHTLDQAFCTNVATLRGDINNVRVLPSGKLLLVGEGALTLGSLTRQDLLQLNADGTADASFDAGLASSSGGAGRVSAVQPDGKILVGGSFTNYNGSGAQRLVRLLPTGAVDATFSVSIGFAGGLEEITLQPDGKILVGGSFTAPNGIVRLLPNGSLDASFSSPLSNVPSGYSRVSMIGLQPDGRILISTGHYGLRFNDGSTALVARLLADGSRDASFAVQSQTGPPPVYNRYDANEFIVQPDGRILVAVQGVYGGQSTNWLIRLNANGTRDASFSAPLPSNRTPTEINSLRLMPNGQLLIAGQNFRLNGHRGDVALLNANGSLDASFNPVLLAGGQVYCVIPQPDGKVLASGVFDEVAGVRTSNVARFNADGSVDAAFTAQAATLFGVEQMVQQPDGKILLAGSLATTGTNPTQTLVRLLPTGATDNSFQPAAGTFVYRFALQPDGRIAITDGADISRLLANGQVDNTFAQATTDGSVYTLLSQPDGKILVGGYWTAFNSQPRRTLVRLLANGSVDASFSSPIQNTPDVEVDELLLQPDRKIIAGGYVYAGMTAAQQAFGLFRTLPDGATDNSFVSSLPVNGSGVGFVRGLTLQPNGRLLVAAYANGVVRKLANGQSDPSFGPISFSSDVEDVAVLANGKLVVGGFFTSVGGQRALGLAGLTAPNVLNAVSPQFNAPTAAWPNPAHEVLRIKLDATARPLSVELLNATGQLVYTQTTPQPQLSLSVGALPTGIYLLRVNYAGGSVVRRVVVR
ncbi:delta-60 repeat domain-containing protein/Por secretion system C-terminal sorting domain-containing protein [Hymenobacter daecheongensis DSM 21074]|uniref:Delta-60 repeat domain-containing protein/Por secretion system C-terminal sorting domain-containing protein n=1 Tax=Hymenobacter daecheongensis DSM 21074 TaxID=1121955 RepID=A0A1M6AF70_9BACT|nr:T9SS type A sorting domain-containing protein [Hymenobacter daecheongensis]SHI35051.1 delta-60 repeat domain-containing protein/Por secretion system C-terminal sorting domain-containing protein [Hymenobacter daecheongensis DSM 21074]